MSRSRNRVEIQTEKLARAVIAGEFLARKCRYIRGIALTGSVAYGDVEEDDDLDFLIITAKNRVWTTRLITYTWAMIMGKKRKPDDERDKWCLNMYLDESALLVPKEKRTDFGKAQIERMVPIYGEEWVAKFRRVNEGWMSGKRIMGEISREEDRNLGEQIGDGLEEILYLVQKWYMRGKVTREIVERKQIFFQPLTRR